MSRVERLGKVERELSHLQQLGSLAQNELNDRIDLSAKCHLALKERIEGLESREIERLKLASTWQPVKWTTRPSLMDRFVAWLNAESAQTLHERAVIDSVNRGEHQNTKEQA